MILLYLVSGLFLGWSLGANDASNLFGSAVGSRLVSFRKAAVVASVFVIIGAVVQGSGTTITLGRLGNVNAVGGSFTVALAAAVTVYLMTKFALPVSTTQAIVGAIIGWNIFTGNSTDVKTLSQIVSAWIAGPILGAVFSIVLYIAVRKIKRAFEIHIIRFESYLKTGLIIAGAFAAYSLGANNIANVMGVFIPSFNLSEIQLGFITLSSAQQLFMMGGIAIAAGIITYSKRVMETVGSNIMELSSEAALVVMLAQALVLFLFSSTSFASFLKGIGLPSFPMVPVSSSQVIVGSVIGIGLYRGARNINFRVLGEIGTGWVATPLMAGLTSFFSLFFVKNIFGIEVGWKSSGSVSQTSPLPSSAGESVSSIAQYLLLALFIIGIISAALFFFLEIRKTKELSRSEEKFWKNLK
ncbi:MAG: inorganic phosphate transporter [Bacteroidales bacterium]|nr:inorganic phosphate transporter [Bacteroidales bacterium]